jgi:hypothetical protein
MLERDEAIKVMQVLDEAGFAYTLHASGRRYEVSVTFERLYGDQLRELQEALRTVPRARMVVEGSLYVRGS